jgi:hypothetical protein
MPFSYNPGWWFIMCYVLLYLLSPILNAAIDSFSKQNYQYALVFLTIVNLYFGFYRNQEFTNYGFSIAHFIYMYFIGGYLSRYIQPLTCKYKKSPLVVYIVGSLIYGIVEIINTRYLQINTSPWLYMSNYNHPLLIITSIALILWFTSLNFSNKFINYIAPSCLSVYLIHDNNWFRDLLYGKIVELYENVFSFPYGSICLIFMVAIIIFVFAITIDQARRMIMKPFINKCDEYYQQVKLKIT